MASELFTPERVDAGLQILFWCLVAFVGLWAVSGLLTHLHRRAYNLTSAESGGSKKIKPDFLTVDARKRQSAIDRGKAYDAVLDARDRESGTTSDKVCFWSRAGAIATALIGLVVTVLGTVTRIDTLQAGVNQISSWDTFSGIISRNKAGAVLAVAVIAISVIEVSKKLKTTPAKA